MNMDLTFLWVIQLAPLISFLLIQLLPKELKKIAPAIGVLGSLVAALATLKLFSLHLHQENLPQQFIYEWLKVAEPSAANRYQLVVGFLVDPLNLLMITLV